MTLGESNPDQSQERSTEQLIVERNAWLDQTLNPGGAALPVVDVLLWDGNMQECQRNLPVDPPFVGNSGSLYLRIPGSKTPIVDMVYGQDPTLPRKLIVTDVSALSEHREHGYGKRLYLEGLKALPPNYGLVSHSLLSKDGERMWTWLVRSGVAKEREEPVHGQIGKYETIF